MCFKETAMNLPCLDFLNQANTYTIFRGINYLKKISEMKAEYIIIAIIAIKIIILPVFTGSLSFSITKETAIRLAVNFQN